MKSSSSPSPMAEAPPAASLRDAWQARWPDALALWSRYTRLSSPRWCETHAAAKAEGLSGSFAMIRLTDHAVVIDLAGVRQHRLENFPLEIMGHEIGHHILVPADLADQGRLLARLRRNLPTREAEAPMIANLYADLLINDRLQRLKRLDMAGVYRRLGGEPDGGSALWSLYMRIYEILWGLQRGTLAWTGMPPEAEGDAQLGARIVRVYGRDWLKGGSRFAALCLPWLLKDEGGDKVGQRYAGVWRDTGVADEADAPDGLAEMDADEDDTLMPVDDPALNDAPVADDAASAPDIQAGRGQQPPADRRYREPFDYRDLLKALGSRLSDREIAMRYYRERAIPHLIRFPQRLAVHATEPLPEGLETWAVGQPLESVDWVESIVRSPVVIPGMTTLERVYGDVAGNEPEKEPLDLYIGIDCSGSMPNPQTQMSSPVLGGTILALSALRAGARVMACLSGEPGQAVATDGFVRSEAAVMELLTGYLGSGYTFGLIRLDDMVERLPPAGSRQRRPVHILILTDMDIFSGLDNGDGRRTGWQIAEEALAAAAGGGTMVLNLPSAARWQAGIDRLQAIGWQVHLVASWEEVPAFAREFARRHYVAEAGR